MEPNSAVATPFAPVFAAEIAPVELPEQEIRQRCCFCAVRHVTDGLGPILDGEAVSDGMCQLAFDAFSAELDAMEAGKVA